MNRWYAAGVVLVLAAAAAGAYYFFAGAPAPMQVEPPVAFTSTPAYMPTTKRQPPQGWQLYESPYYGFSFFYPQGLKVTEYDEGQGARTIVLEDAEGGRGFQIAILPYSKPQISEERFLKDAPLGVREGLRDVTIDKAVGATFFGKDAVLGDTAEVWFIYHGYLYEVTTLRPLSSWLEPIVTSWQFSP